MKTTTIIGLFIAAAIITGCACEPLTGKGVSVTEAKEDCANKDTDHCLKDLGEKELNPDICLEIGRTGPLGKCLINVAESINDPNLCEKLPDGGYYTKEECYYHIAKSMNNPEYCSDIPDGYSQDKNDLTNAFTKDDCIKEAEKGFIKEKGCGVQGLPCCADNGCEDVDGIAIFCSEQYRCEPYGSPNYRCNPDKLGGDGCFNSSGYCGDDDYCHECGIKGERCCRSGSACLEGSSCNAGTCI